MSSVKQSKQSKILIKHINETDFLKAILNKTSNYYITKKELLINLERGLYGLSVIDNQIIKYDKEDLKRYNKEPKKFRELIFQESLKISIYIIINEQLKKNDLMASLRDTRTKLKEKNTLNLMLNQLSSVKSHYGDTNEQVKKSAYDFYNSNYNDKININEKSLYNDIKVINIFTAYLNVISQWTADEINELAEELYKQDK
tara:strand:- start:200 stop:802 length:603 start_codon:yes stop_codon:yes gene_type:complete